MTNTRGSAAQDQDVSVTAVTVTIMAGVFLGLVGVFHIGMGIVALVNNNIYLHTAKYTFQFNITTWGWIHIIAGLVVLVAAVGLFTGAVWARTIAIAVAALSIIANFLWLPYYPWWAIVLITFDAFVIWALTAHGRDITNV